MASAIIDDRAAWLERRRAYIGASDTASILGKGFSTPLGVYSDKLGLPNPEPDADSKLRMEIGLTLEPLLGQFFTIETGIPLKRVETLIHPDYPFIGANLDFVTEDGQSAIEVKTYGIGRHSEFGEEGSDDIPDGYHIQLTKQIGIARLNGYPMEGGHLYALNLGTTTRKIFSVPFDEAFFALLIERDVKFWREHIEPKVPPLATAKDEDRVRLMFPADNGEQVLAEPEDDDLIRALMDLAPKRKAVCEQYDTLKAQLIERMGPYAAMQSIYGIVRFVTAKGASSIDYPAALKAKGITLSPDELATYTVTKAGSRRLYLPKEAS